MWGEDDDGATALLIYVARRLALALVTCAAISVLTFIIIRLPPADFVDAYIANLAASGSTVTEEQAAAMRREYGLDRPVPVQYVLWMGRVVRGDFGVSMMWRRPVTEVIGDRLWLTMAVSLAALFLTGSSRCRVEGAEGKAEVPQARQAG